MAIANGENDMNKNEILKILEKAKDKNGEVPMRLVRQAFEKLPEPCEDAISRRDAIDSVEESRRLNHHQDGKEACAHEYEHRHFLKILLDLPSAQPEDYAHGFADGYKQGQKDAQPERKKGEWIYGEKDGQDGWYCSECKGFIPWDYDYYGLNDIDFIKDFKTCPFCDSKMISCTGSDNMKR